MWSCNSSPNTKIAFNANVNRSPDGYIYLQICSENTSLCYARVASRRGASRSRQRHEKSDERKSAECTRAKIPAMQRRVQLPRSLDIGLTYFESARLKCKNIIKCRATERARVGEPRIFSCAQCVYPFDVAVADCNAQAGGRVSGSGRGAARISGS